MKIAIIAATLAGLASCDRPWKQSGKVFWDYNCDFYGDDIGQVASRGEDCGGHCENTPGCHKFTYYNGVCYMKMNSAINPQEKSGAVCGYLDAPISWNEEGSLSWARDCDFWGGDIETLFNVPSNLCGSRCEQNRNCNSFTWSSSNGGTCFLKRLNVLDSKPLVVGGGGVCGYITPRIHSILTPFIEALGEVLHF
jgi:hypothetical protein